MTKSLKVILAATTIAALASPAMAQQSERHRHTSSASIAHSHGSAIRTREHAHEVVHRKPVENSQTYHNDCGSDIYAQCNY
jgi:Tfp pilus assembly protein FimT